MKNAPGIQNGLNWLKVHYRKTPVYVETGLTDIGAAKNNDSSYVQYIRKIISEVFKGKYLR